jgi:hypothetical protein
LRLTSTLLPKITLVTSKGKTKRARAHRVLTVSGLAPVASAPQWRSPLDLLLRRRFRPLFLPSPAAMVASGEGEGGPGGVQVV